MHPAGELRRQRGVHGARPRHAGHAAKRIGHDKHGVMRLAAGLRAGMSGMLRAVIHHAQQDGENACLRTTSSLAARDCVSDM